MIDSVLKGTGNSRFLKSAVPAGTSWADALAMLQAGTFPIDFNGINTEGFQQVGTPLNKANLLKDATAAQIGLPPSTTPDGMFQALGNTGELHVWRKTVTTAQEIPAGYTLGELQTGNFQFVGSNYVNWAYGTPVVGDNGTVSLNAQGSMNVDYNSNLNDLRGKYCRPTSDSGIFLSTQVIFIPSDAVFTRSNGVKYVNKYQSLIGTPKIPAGTTTTYPVSTNPKAYQEGDDAKPAGYTLGEVVTGKYYLGNANVGYSMHYKTATSLSVSDNGILSMPTDATSVYVEYSKNGLTTDQIKSYFAGKFVQSVAVGSDSVFSPSSLFKTAPSEILFIPSDSVITKDEFKNFNIDRYQPVTGYAAIPAGTTIEYLGKLGDKAMVQVVSYVGTGIYGSSNPNSVTANFPIKLLAVVAKALKNSNGNFTTRIDFDNQHREDPFMIGAALTTDYTLGSGCGYKENVYNTSYGKKSNDGKTFSWYTTGNNAARQFNESGYTYTVLLIG